MTTRSGMLGTGALIAISAALVWWVWSASPSQGEIEAAKYVIPPLPVVNLQQLENGALENRTINGTLPISVDGGSLGREDPFAGI
ncbi:hypothetical protein HY524_00055 [Candidatus Berkelbacteria bacterium]|nr:hypothetical protein [Candidatus Berkelbacteria bacterium]